jgi:VanZ family protein
VNFLNQNISIRQIILAFLPSVIWAGVIFVFSSQTALPTFQESFYDFVFKKMAHIFVYLVLYLLVFQAVQQTFSNEHHKLKLLFPIIICMLYAISDEFHQSLVPGRYATLRDIGYDLLGVGIAFLKKYNYI